MPLSLLLLALAVFAMGTSEFMLAGLVPDLASDLGVPVGSAGLLTTAFAVGMVVGAPVMAASTRRLPGRVTLLGCLAVFAVAHVVGAVTAHFAVLFVSRTVAALANAGFLAVALTLAGRLVAPNRKGRAVAVLLAGTTVAMVAGVPGGALLGAALGWRSTFWAIALLSAVAAVGLVRGLPANDPANHPAGDPAAGAVRPPLRTELAQLAVPRVVVTMTLAALVNAGTFAALTYLAPIVTDTAALDAWWVPVALVLFGAGSFAGVVAAGRVSDRRPRRVIAAGGALLLAGWIALALLAAHPVGLLGLVLVQGALAFGVGSTLIARVLYAAADAPTMGGSYATAALNVGAAVGPVVGAVALSTALGGLGPVWVAAAATALALAIAVPALRLVAPRPAKGQDRA